MSQCPFGQRWESKKEIALEKWGKGLVSLGEKLWVEGWEEVYLKELGKALAMELGQVSVAEAGLAPMGLSMVRMRVSVLMECQCAIQGACSQEVCMG